MSSLPRSTSNGDQRPCQPNEGHEERTKMIEAINGLLESTKNDAGNEASNDDNNNVSNQIAAVERTHMSIQSFESRLATLNANKRKIRPRNMSVKSSKEKKQRKIDDDIKLTKKAIKTLRKSLEVQLVELNKMNKQDSEKDPDDSSSDDSDDASDNESSDN